MRKTVSQKKVMPKVSVIIVSYNTRDLTAKSIKHAQSSIGFKPGEIEIILVDNNSSDDTIKYLKRNFKDIIYIENKDNKGFGGANNQGVEIARGKYCLLLNTDAFLGANSLAHMVQIMDQRDDIVSVGPQLRYQDGSMQLSGGYLPTPWRVIGWMWWLDKIPIIKNLFPRPYHVFDLEWHERDQYPEWLMGACVLFRTEEFKAAGGFDDKIFMYAEEVELYRRLKTSLGKKVFFTSKTQVVHIGGASSKKANAYRLVHELKGIKYIYEKHYRHLLLFIRFVLFTGVVMRITVFSLIKSRHEALTEYRKYFTDKS